MSKTSFATRTEELLYGLKKIDLKNWQAPDLPTLFDITGDQWVTRVLEPKLSPNVPVEVDKLFQIARGSLIYGWYYYPLITLALEQQFRVMELAAVIRCDVAGISPMKQQTKGKPRHKTFADRIADLVAANIIDSKDSIRWTGSRGLRNSRSHPKGMMIMTPGQACQSLKSTCELINKLFQ